MTRDSIPRRCFLAAAGAAAASALGKDNAAKPQGSTVAAVPVAPPAGELDVFLSAQRRHADAQAAGIVICPGVGFDVIPTDCLAAVLKEALPDATHLVLAFDARAHVSPGTARTVAESFRLGRLGGRVRRNGVIEEVPLAHSRRSVDFAVGSCCR
jgi:short subunit dehydrogenase-like uncharacterized protein